MNRDKDLQERLLEYEYEKEIDYEIDCNTRADLALYCYHYGPCTYCKRKKEHTTRFEREEED